MQLSMTPFLGAKNAREFMKDLWELLISAQNSGTGIPAKLLQEKKAELLSKQVSLLIHTLFAVSSHALPPS